MILNLLFSKSGQKINFYFKTSNRKPNKILLSIAQETQLNFKLVLKAGKLSTCVKKPAKLNNFHLSVYSDKWQHK